MIERFWFWFLPLVVRALFIPHFEIGRVRDRVYNTRYTIVPTWVACWFGKHAVFLHHFQSDDATNDFHNHPYDHSTAYILAGGYWEERAFFIRALCQRLQPSLAAYVGATWLDYRAGEKNELRPHTFHRVELIDKVRGCWTLFVAGEKVQPWGFWNRNTGEFRKWTGKPPGLPPPEFYDGPPPEDGAA